MKTVYLALGTNLGDKVLNLNQAIQEISKRIGLIKAQSAYYISEPWGFKSDNGFLNAVVAISTNMQPLELLHETQQIEIDLGRQIKSNNKIYADRIIDIDLLLIDQIIFKSEDLNLPHPHILDRDFVYLPLLEIAPDITHPITQKRISESVPKKHTLETLKEKRE